MRNKYAGICYKCGKDVAAGAGYFERHRRSWRVQHVGCKDTSAIVWKNAPGGPRVLTADEAADVLDHVREMKRFEP